MSNSLITFSHSLGLVIQGHLPIGRWFRVPTTTHPKKRNGSIFYGVEYAHLCNWEDGTTHTWFADKEAKPNPDVMRRMAEASARQDAKRVQDAARASQTAREMLSRAHAYTHPYLEAKGFPKHRGEVLDDSLLIRMTDLRGAVVGLQEIKMVDGDFR